MNLIDRRYGIGLVLLMGAAIAASTARAQAPAHADPCSLITRAEVEHIVGKLKAAPKADKEGQASWCNYEFANGKDAFEIWVFPGEGIDRARRVAKSGTTVKGLGEDAFLTRGLHGLDYVNLYVRKNNRTINLALQYTSGDEDKVKALAQRALARM